MVKLRKESISLYNWWDFLGKGYEIKYQDYAPRTKTCGFKAHLKK
jgi:hypothetical protein